MLETEAPVLVKWSELYSVGIQHIDEEHKKLLDLLNELWRSMMEGKGRDHIGRTLEGLIQYTLTHFETEEVLMREHAYPGYEAHRQQHEKLTAQVRTMQAQYLGGHGTSARELMLFMQGWIVRHIVASDKKYAPYLQGAGGD
ncbi:MAG: hemerythrin family protein [Bryobacterales bacterium]|nr:hemerythrin family protein [Bryobacterales bacterium]